MLDTVTKSPYIKNIKGTQRPYQPKGKTVTKLNKSETRIMKHLKENSKYSLVLASELELGDKIAWMGGANFMGLAEVIYYTTQEEFVVIRFKESTFQVSYISQVLKKD